MSQKDSEPLSLPIPPEFVARLRPAQLRFDKASTEAQAAMTAATEGGATSVEQRQEAIARARAALDALEAARSLLGGIEEEIVAANERSGADMSKQRSKVVSDAEDARQFFRKERARLAAQEAALRDLKGPIGSA